MKKNILIYIGMLQILIIFSIILFVFIDMFKPSIYAAEKAYKNGDFYKARSIYTKLYNDNLDKDLKIEYLKGIVSCYEETKNIDKAEDLLLKYYSQSNHQIPAINLIISFYSNNNLIDNYKIFINNLIRAKGEKWVNKNINVLKPQEIEITDANRVKFTYPIFLASFTNNSYSLRLNNKNSNSYYDMSLVSILSVARNRGYYDYEKLNSLKFYNPKQLYQYNGKLYKIKGYSKFLVSDVNSQANDLFEINHDLLSGYKYNKKFENPGPKPDIFVYKKSIFINNSLIKKASIGFPSIDSVVDNLNGTYTITGNIYYITDNKNEQVYNYIFNSLAVGFNQFSTWKYKEEFVASCQFSARLSESLDENTNSKTLKIINFNTFG